MKLHRGAQSLPILFLFRFPSTSPTSSTFPSPSPLKDWSDEVCDFAGPGMQRAVWSLSTLSVYGSSRLARKNMKLWCRFLPRLDGVLDYMEFWNAVDWISIVSGLITGVFWLRLVLGTYELNGVITKLPMCLFFLFAVRVDLHSRARLLFLDNLLLSFSFIAVLLRAETDLRLRPSHWRKPLIWQYHIWSKVRRPRQVLPLRAEHDVALRREPHEDVQYRPTFIRTPS